MAPVNQEVFQERKVQHGTADEAFSGELITASKFDNHAVCKHCGSHRIYRVIREGYLQEKIFPMFGYYPWKCKNCKSRSLLKLRKFSRSKSKESAGLNHADRIEA